MANKLDMAGDTWCAGRVMCVEQTSKCTGACTAGLEHKRERAEASRCRLVAENGVEALTAGSDVSGLIFGRRETACVDGTAVANTATAAATATSTLALSSCRV